YVFTKAKSTTCFLGLLWGAATACTSPAPAPYVAPSGGGARCGRSADCPAGTYCDLAECVQACSAVTPCAGGLACSARGRCLAAEASTDRDPPPPLRNE